MRKQQRLRKVVVLDPSEYELQELVVGPDYVAVNHGELEGAQLPIMSAAWLNGEDNLMVTFTEERSWRSLWLWKPYTRISDVAGSTLPSPFDPHRHIK